MATVTHEPSLEPAAALRGTALDYFRALRPRQWVKNGLLFIGILFSVDRGHPASDWLKVFGAFLIFCALASAIYLVNDVSDLEQDRLHPRKRKRPIAAGLVPVRAALIMAALLGAVGLAASAALGLKFFAVALFYAVLTVSYSFWLKHEVILDVMALAGCYVVRAAAGAIAIGVNVTPWLMVCTSLGALLVGLGKRRNELTTLEDAVGHRRALTGYTLPLLDQMITIAAAGTLLAYVLYTFFSTTGIDHRRWLMVTNPFVVYGVFRFLFMVHRRGKGGDPSTELFQDPHMMVCALLWLLTCAAVLLLSR
jgi:4-hydroxybenzoate polyprenyltransferase